MGLEAASTAEIKNIWWTKKTKNSSYIYSMAELFLKHYAGKENEEWGV